MTFYSGNSFFLLLSSSPFSFFLLPSLPLACVALPDRSSRNAISLVQRLSFGENEDVVKHLGMIYLSLDHGAPGSTNVPPPSLFIFFVSCLCRKKIYVDSREMHSLFVIFPDKSKGQAQLPLSTNFFSTVNQLAKLYRLYHFLLPSS